MSPSDRDPLSPEERALATQLQRLGGPDGPPAALDARILAAARAATAEPPRPARHRVRPARWWTAGAMTAAGTAAAFVVVIGAVWRLQPAERAPEPVPATGDDGVVAVELLAPRGRAATDAPAAAREAGPPPAPSADRPERTARASNAASAEAGPPPVPREAAAARAIQPPEAGSGAPAPTADPAAAAGVQEPPAAPTAAAAEDVAATGTARSTPAATAAERVERARRATYTTAARARAESQRGSGSANARTAVHAPPAVDLDTIPIGADARLPPVEWLERVRARRDAGDIEGARASLQRFTRSHPRLRLPPDLRELAR